MLAMCKQTLKDQFTWASLKSWGIALLFAVVLSLLFVLVSEAAVDKTKLTKEVNDAVGSGSWGQIVLGGIALVISAIFFFAGNIKMAVTIFAGVAVLLGVYNSGSLGFGA
ncbi:hypothetical protein [Cysteiniphilum halobium]|uniref:hypothetical protein n=1 Tax=Cysteiniphilum halobium TaxID=2219059 RepID=UPI000E658FFC|nr:hypothetical protein [Cysteiniphilum halobium]